MKMREIAGGAPERARGMDAARNFNKPASDEEINSTMSLMLTGLDQGHGILHAE